MKKQSTKRNTRSSNHDAFRRPRSRGLSRIAASMLVRSVKYMLRVLIGEVFLTIRNHLRRA